MAAYKPQEKDTEEDVKETAEKLNKDDSIIKEDLFVDTVYNESNKAETSSPIHNCPCGEILISAHSAQCGICNKEITSIKQFHDQLTELKDTAVSLKSQLEESTSVYTSYVRQYKTLSRQLEKRQQQLTDTAQRIESLEQDIEIVKVKHKDEIAHSIALEQSKLGVQSELHDLSKKLFEEANQMVIQEKEKKLKIQANYKLVKRQFQTVQDELDQVEGELKVLRDKMSVEAQQQQEKEPNKSTHENYMLRAQLDMAMLLGQQQLVQVEQKFMAKDNLLITEFRQAIYALKSTSFLKVSSLGFMKELIKVDIEPCLRFGPRLNYRKLIDPILQKTCLLERCSESEKRILPTATKKANSLWGRLMNNTGDGISRITIAEDTQTNCYACNKPLDESNKYVWKFKSSYFEDWNLIDSFCKDRIQSVIDFYNFLRKLKVMNDYELTSSIESLYEEYSRLQLQILLSRMGILPTLLRDFTVSQ